jgi:hypothetical protein
MSGFLTVQVGTQSNWVGSHYWSSLYRSAWSDDEVDLNFNESDRGSVYPRLFVVDTKDGFGVPEIPTEPIAPYPGMTVHQTDTVRPDLHPLRKLAIETELYNVTDTSALSNIPYRAWSDFWELPTLPAHRLILPPNERLEYWFETPKMDFDETDLRHLLERTETSIGVVRLMADSAMTGPSSHITEYLRNAFPRASLEMPVRFHDVDRSAGLVNMAGLFHSMEYLRMIAVPPTTERLRSSAVQAVWEDCTRRLRRDDDSPRMTTPVLNINGELNLFDNTSETGRFIRESVYMKSIANPLTISPGSVIKFDSRFGEDTRVLLEETCVAVRRFQALKKPIWEPFSMESDDFDEIIETFNQV